MKEALKRALVALQKTQSEEYNLPATAIEEAITAIKAALAQDEKPMVSYERFMSVEKELADMTAEFMSVAKQLAQPIIENYPEKDNREPVAWMDIDEKGGASGLRYWSEPDNRHEVALYILKENT